MKRQRIDSYSGPKTLGFDVSRYQGIIEWDKLDEDLEFVFIRTGDGRSRDHKFVENWRSAWQAGIRRGAYHYFRADRDGATQAGIVLNMLEEAGGFKAGIDLPPVIDVEGGTARNLPGGIFTESSSNLPIQVIVEECLEFLKILEDKLGIRPLVYTGQAIHWWLSQREPLLASLFEEYPLWIASYTTYLPYMPVDKTGRGLPWKEWTFWQFTSKGESAGIVGDLDMNYFRGTTQELEKFIKGSIVQKDEIAEVVTPDIPIVNQTDVFALLQDIEMAQEQLRNLKTGIKRITVQLSSLEEYAEPLGGLLEDLYAQIKAL